MQPLREGRTLSDQISAGLTWILPAAVLVVLSVLVPFYVIYGMEGTGEMLQLVKPLSMLPYTIIRMLVVYAGIYLLAAVIFASVEYYNLDMIISIGYRAKSNRGVEFRRWANYVLWQYLYIFLKSLYLRAFGKAGRKFGTLLGQTKDVISLRNRYAVFLRRREAPVYK